jgi:GMP synthase-like glutamine amidotransferase
LSARPKIRLGVLQTGAPPGVLGEQFGSYSSMFRRLLGEVDFDFTDFDVRAGAFPPAADACAAYIVTGSASGAYDADGWIADLRAFLVAAKGPGGAGRGLFRPPDHGPGVRRPGD